jgi:hypothetical protein
MDALITCTNDHGTFRTTGYGLDRTIGQCLPASVNSLRDQMERLNPGTDYSDVHSVSEFLIMVADITSPVSG